MMSTRLGGQSAYRTRRRPTHFPIEICSKKDNKCTDPDLSRSHAVVRVVNEELDADGPALTQLAGRQEANAAQQLELAALQDRSFQSQKTVQQVDGQREDLLLAVLLLSHLLNAQRQKKIRPQGYSSPFPFK